MKDIDAKYGIGIDAQYHAILTTAMKDLAAAYQLGIKKVSRLSSLTFKIGVNG